MFYSQFILAKKGPLGTIWIAAHLERKLRKNQVADTDIGVSVDSILSPDVPIALRLSSHLLLGVVRIYSRKVNYLFDDCSEALLKIKQAFRSAAVDLPPEESKAPYHSITMPETFDLDDFELPENDILQGNFVDHHISSREQITLQDTMEGVSYSTSKFGLDERFGDGDACEIDLDEELLLDKSRTSESAVQGADLGTSVSLLEEDELSKTADLTPEALFNRDDHTDLFDCAQAPSTPGLGEEPNLSKASASGSDEHPESEYTLVACTMAKNAKESFNNEDKPDGDLCSSFEMKPPTELSGEADDLDQVSEVQKRASDEDKNFSESLFDEKIDAERSALEICGVTSSSPLVLGELSASVEESHVVEATHSVEIENLKFNSEALSSAQNMKTEDYHSTNGQPDIRLHERDMSPDIYAQFDAAVLESSGKGETSKHGEVGSSSGTLESIMKENHGQGPPSVEDAPAELLEPEKLMCAPDGHLDESRPALAVSSPKEVVGFMEVDDQSKIISGKKRSFTESTLTEQSLNASESSRQVRFKQMTGSVPDDDDLLSSILVGRSSALKVKPTPRLTEVTSEKRTRTVPRAGAYKRKVLMDDTMVLHGDMIRQQLVDTEDIHRVRKKAPCSCSEISMLRRQFSEDEILLEPMFSGMSNELVLLHCRPCDFSGITVVKSEQQDDASIQMMAADDQKPSVSAQDVENIEILGIENDSRNGPLSTAEQSGELITSEHLLERSEPTDTGENADFGKEQTRTENSQEELLLNATGEEASIRNDDDANSSFVPKTGEMKLSDPDIPDGMKDTAIEPGSSEMDFANGQTVKNDIEGADASASVTIEPEHGHADGGLPEMDQEFEHLLTNDRHKDIEYDERIMMAGDSLGKDATFSYQEDVDLEKDVLIDTHGNPELSGPYLYDMFGTEDSVQHLHDQDEPKHPPAEIDTEFLNMDDDDDDEQIADENLPVDEDTLFAQNTGWSSRTRAVSKYLQTLFKEADGGRRSLSMDTLLSGKSRKEASRMFFEALVLKTRDHIHVEQSKPFEDIAIKPRPRLMKSSF